MPDTFEMIKKYSDKIENNRTVNDIFIHTSKELIELNDELDLKAKGQPPGDDGIIGEAIDVISCCYDLIMKENPNFTSQDFHSFLDKKLRKWETKYSKMEAKVHE